MNSRRPAHLERSHAIVDIAPFRGIRYDPAIVDPDAVIAPPYDVVADDYVERLHARSPHNVAHIESPAGSGEGRYLAAAGALASAQEAGALRRDAQPSYYVYEQRSDVQGQRIARRCFFVRMRLSPYSEGVVRPHESTMAGPKADRLDLMRATRMNVSPLMVMVADPSGEVRNTLEAATSQAADFTAIDDRGDEHRLWVLDDAVRLDALTEAVRPSRATIADGHHRYETALNYLAEQPQTLAPDAPARFVLAGLVPEDEPGLVILPNHRLLPGTDVPAEFEQRLAETYEVTSWDGSVETLWGHVQEAAGERPTFGVLVAGEGAEGPRRLLLSARSTAAIDAAMPAEWSPASRAIDVLILNETILEPLLGIDEAARSAGAVEFSEDLATVAERVERGDCRLAFLVNPVRVEQVVAIADAGEVLPQKSTFYYPKLATGMVLNPLDD